MRKIEFLDFAKGYAIFTIVVYHALQWAGLPPIFQQAIIFGGTGVHLFFLLSGFGLALSKSSASPLEFYRRRLVKVWLPYVLALTISLLAAVALDLFPDRWPAWLAGVGLYQMFFEKYVQSFGGHFWFISAIIQFYLAYPLLRWLRNWAGNPWLFFGICLLVSMLWWELVFALGKGPERIWSSCFLQFLWEFALGMVLAETSGRLWPRGEKAGLEVLPVSQNQDDNARQPWLQNLAIGLIFSGLMIAMILKMGQVGRIFNDIPALIGYTALSIFLFHFSGKFLPAVRRFFLWVGGFSFSLYLIHVLVLELYLQCLRLQNLPLNVASLLAYLPLAVAAGWAFEPVSAWWTGLFEKRKMATRNLTNPVWGS